MKLKKTTWKQILDKVKTIAAQQIPMALAIDELPKMEEFEERAPATQ